MTIFVRKVSWTRYMIVVTMGVLALLVASQLVISHVFGPTTMDGYIRREEENEDPLVPLGNNHTKLLAQLEKPPVQRCRDAVVDEEFVSLWSGNSAGLDNELGTADLSSVQSNNYVEDDLRSCDLYKGNWIYDHAGPLYTNNSCPILTQSQNCQGNGRPDRDYENWRWRPNQCVLPRFNAAKFLELMRGKTLAFIGDSIARNQMESLLCILWQASKLYVIQPKSLVVAPALVNEWSQMATGEDKYPGKIRSRRLNQRIAQNPDQTKVEVPKNHGNLRVQRWIFESASITIIRIWSAWLVHKSTAPLQYASRGVTEVHLDTPDESFMELLPEFDVVVISSGHWFDKQTFYILNGTIMEEQHRQKPKRRSRGTKTDNARAYGISVKTALTAIATHPNYTGLTVLRTYTPDHYKRGAWNTGGSCSENTRPSDRVVRNGYTDLMHEKQVASFRQAEKKLSNGSKLKLMDITEVSGYRHDGHPGRYRSPSWQTTMTRRGTDAKTKPQDCLHWCMPGPVETWNEILFEIIRREFEKA